MHPLQFAVAVVAGLSFIVAKASYAVTYNEQPTAKNAAKRAYPHVMGWMNEKMEYLKAAEAAAKG